MLEPGKEMMGEGKEKTVEEGKENNDEKWEKWESPFLARKFFCCLRVTKESSVTLVRAI
jgi:hypothetical protein